MATSSKSIAVVDEASPEDVVEMSVSKQMGYGMEFAEVYVVADGGFFLVVESAAIDDNCIERIVADNVTILTKRIDGEGLNGNHRV